MEERDELISCYFRLGLSNAQIVKCLLLQHRLLISIRTLKRCLHKMNLFRKLNYTDDFTVATFIQHQLHGAGQMHGYRWMHLKCLHAGFTVTHETVRLLISVLDPYGVAIRKRRRLRRRTYYNEGPNMVWHMDGYDKLKPYGIAIHGCIDGFSRHIVWLHAYTTNNDPKVIASYYLAAVSACGGCPRTVRADLGTENVNVEQMQLFLRGDQSAFIYGRSVNNQRIECWWGMLRRQNMQFWINLFEELKEEDFTGSFIDKSLVQFCFLHLVQVFILAFSFSIVNIKAYKLL